MCLTVQYHLSKQIKMVSTCAVIGNWQKPKKSIDIIYPLTLFTRRVPLHWTLATGHPLALPMGNWPRMRQSITYWYLLLLLSPAGCNKLRTRSDITICIARMPSLHLQTLSSPELHNCKTGEIVQFFRDLETLCKNENGSVSERMWPLQHFTTWTKLIFSTSFSSS